MPKTNGQTWQCRYSPTLGALESTPEKIWGTLSYENDTDPTVFMGIYGFPDFYTLWRHKGRKCVLWCGSDIRHFARGYWLIEGGDMRLDPGSLAPWLNKYCENYVENEVEKKELARYGIRAKVVPSFLGDVNNFKVCFQPGNKLYTSVSGNDYEVYGWDKIPALARYYPEIEFHLYGNTGKKLKAKNVIDHGRIPKEQMNEEIRRMQGPLRLTKFDGFSEIIAKGLLMGQYPVSIIRYPHTFDTTEIDQIAKQVRPNVNGREWALKHVNQFPWNKFQMLHTQS